MYISWGLCIDVEGFSANYEHSEDRKTFAILALGELMSAIHRVGSKMYPGTSGKNYTDRLFAYQFGDGFLVSSDLCDTDATRPTAIAIALMRHMIICGFATKAAIAIGEMSGINGCYPQPMRDAPDSRVNMGMGLMTTIPVMGTALTKAHKLGSRSSGATLALDPALASGQRPEGAVLCGANRTCVDWISSEIDLVSEIASVSELKVAGRSSLVTHLSRYMQASPRPPESWIASTLACITT